MPFNLEPQKTMLVMRTERKPDGVLYQVLTQAREVLWERFVKFNSSRRADRARYPFVAAAREQEYQAQKALSIPDKQSLHP